MILKRLSGRAHLNSFDRTRQLEYLNGTPLQTVSKITLLLLLSCFCLKAQDVHFSQYYFSPLSLNPANTGNFKGDHRFFANYRTQWRDLDKGYNTYSAGGDLNMFFGKTNMGAGLVLINDLSAQYLSVTKILPSAAFHWKLSGFKVHLGVQPGVVIKSINFYKHSFPEQLNWTTGKFDNSLPNTEPYAGNQAIYFDGSAGTQVSRKFGRLEPMIGFSVFHINQPVESLVGDTKNKLPMRQAVNADLRWKVASAVVLQFHSLYGTTTKASDWVSGINVEYILSDNAFFTNSIFGGFMWRDGWKRNSDAAIFTAGFNRGHYTLGFSFDLTQSKLKTTVNNQGAYEIAFIYRSKSTRLSSKVVPCERY